MAPQRRNWFSFGRVQDYPLPRVTNTPQLQSPAAGIPQQQHYPATKKDIDSNEAALMYGGVLYTTTYPTKKKATNYQQYGNDVNVGSNTITYPPTKKKATNYDQQYGNDVNVGSNNVYYYHRSTPVPAKNEYQHSYHKFTTTVREEGTHHLGMVYKADEN